MFSVFTFTSDQAVLRVPLSPLLPCRLSHRFGESLPPFDSLLLNMKLGQRISASACFKKDPCFTE